MVWMLIQTPAENARLYDAEHSTRPVRWGCPWFPRLLRLCVPKVTSGEPGGREQQRKGDAENDHSCVRP